jgi:hypothetical protein
MVLFALAAFLLLPAEGSRRQKLRISLSLLCQLASLLSHETGVVTPVIAALLFVLRRDGKVARGRLKVLPFFLLPLFCFAALRLVFYGGVGRTYALEPEHGWVSTGVVNAIRLLAKPFFPWETEAVVFGERSLRVVIGVLMNLAGYALVGYALLPPGKAGRKPLLRVLLCLAAALAVLWIAPEARFMQLAAVFSVLAAIVAAEEISHGTTRPWLRRGVALGFVGLAAGQLLIYLTSFTQLRGEHEDWNRQTRAEFQGLQKAIATASVPTLLLVNDRQGWAIGQALAMAAWPNRGRVRRLVAVNGLLGGSSAKSSLRISRDNQAVHIEIVAGPGQKFSFPDVVESQLGSRFVNQGLYYEVETVCWYSFTARLLSHVGRKVEPDRVGFGRRLVVTVPPEIARSGLLVVGFDPRDMSWFSNDLLR